MRTLNSTASPSSSIQDRLHEPSNRNDSAVSGTAPQTAAAAKIKHVVRKDLPTRRISHLQRKDDRSRRIPLRESS